MSDAQEFRLDLAHPDRSADPQTIGAAMRSDGDCPMAADAAGAPGTLAGQRLVATRRHVVADRRRFRVEAPSPEVRDALRLMALEDLLFPEVPR